MSGPLEPSLRSSSAAIPRALLEVSQKEWQHQFECWFARELLGRLRIAHPWCRPIYCERPRANRRSRSSATLQGAAFVAALHGSANPRRLCVVFDWALCCRTRLSLAATVWARAFAHRPQRPTRYAKRRKQARHTLALDASSRLWTPDGRLV